MSYSRKFAEKLGEKYHLPVVYVDKMLYSNKAINEYELYETAEMRDGIKQFLNKEARDKIHDLASMYLKDMYYRECETYHEIFELANKETISSTKEAKKVVEMVAKQVITQKERKQHSENEK